MSEQRYTLPAEGFARLPAICAVCSMSPASIWRRVAAKTFPQPIRFGARMTAWRVEAVREYLRDPLNYRADTAVGAE